EIPTCRSRSPRFSGRATGSPGARSPAWWRRWRSLGDRAHPDRPLVAPRLRAQRSLLAREWKAIVLLGLLGGGVYNVLQYWGPVLHQRDQRLVSEFADDFIIVLGAALLRDPFPRASAAGASVSLAGAMAIIKRPGFRSC